MRKTERWVEMVGTKAVSHALTLSDICYVYLASIKASQGRRLDREAGWPVLGGNKEWM